MRKGYKNLNIILVLLMITGCNQTENSYLNEKFKKTSKRFQLEKQNQITLKSDSAQFGRFRQQFVHSIDDEYWAFHDIAKQQIFVFKSNGEFKTTIGSKGSGPAEFQNVYGYNFSEENTIFAFDENLNAFKHFNLEGSLVKTISGLYEDGFFQSHPQLFVNSNKLYIPVTESEYNTHDFSLLWRSALVAVYNTDGDFLHTLGRFGEPAKNPDTYNVRAMLDIDFEKNVLLASYSTSYQMGEFHFGNLDYQYFGEISPNFKLSNEETRVTDSFNQILEKGLLRSAPMAAYITTEYYIFYFQNLSQEWYDTRDPNTKDHYLVFYNPETHKYEGELKLPNALGTITRNGKIRLIENIDPDNYTISTYTIIIEENE